MAAGRPLKFKSVKDLQSKIDAYFDSCWDEIATEKPAEIKDGKYKEQEQKNTRIQVRPYTITGLALALDTTRETLLDYENKESRAEYSDTIKKAKLRCHNFAEEQLFIGKAAAGPIFNLKNNYGWKDQQQLEHMGEGGGPIRATVEVVFGKQDKNTG